MWPIDEDRLRRRDNADGFRIIAEKAFETAQKEAERGNVANGAEIVDFGLKIKSYQLRFKTAKRKLAQKDREEEMRKRQNTDAVENASMSTEKKTEEKTPPDAATTGHVNDETAEDGDDELDEETSDDKSSDFEEKEASQDDEDEAEDHGETKRVSQMVNEEESEKLRPQKKSGEASC
ncbi:uncharacterized protein BKA78DRAFT_379702 [Phyllosticta capitalensis]|uniref:uncharacterized protein n=1 Tax=Phyllosticta capitalensis TaxID=121624 RepID=UPI003130D982